MKQGTDPRSAFETAINDFIDKEPALTPVISKALKLVDASDDKTVDQYDAALSDYVSTGNDSNLRSLAPIIAEDTLALAVRDGEITQEEATNGDLGKALGFEPGQALVDAVAAKAQQASNEQTATPQAQSFSFGQSEEASSQIDNGPSVTNVVNSSQVSLGGGPTGYVARGALKDWARNTPNGYCDGSTVEAEDAQSL